MHIIRIINSIFTWIISFRTVKLDTIISHMYIRDMVMCIDSSWTVMNQLFLWNFYQRFSAIPLNKHINRFEINPSNRFVVAVGHFANKRSKQNSSTTKRFMLTVFEFSELSVNDSVQFVTFTFYFGIPLQTQPLSKRFSRLSIDDSDSCS